MKRIVDPAKIWQLRLEGKRVTEICELTGYRASTVNKYLGLLGLTQNQGDWVRKTHKDNDPATLARWAKAMPW